MRGWRVGAVWAGVIVLALVGLHARAENAALKTVAHVDLEQYIGKWYEVARYPNRFERECARDVTAEYAERPGGEISVVNQCVKADGGMKRSEGRAKVVDKASNAKLKVTFFWPFYGDYWVIDLGEHYEYAVVSEPSRKYLWILSRTPSLDAGTYAAIVGRLKEKGFDVGRLAKTEQR
jgi:apolipoprotein D and lipocalin family protein